MKPRPMHVPALVIGLSCAVAIWTVSASANLFSTARTPRAQKARAAKMRNLTTGLDTNVAGSINPRVWLGGSAGTPTALASADFDEDGTADLVSAYSNDASGTLLLQRGNVDAIYPNSKQANARRAKGQFTDAPFLPNPNQFSASISPDFISAGDFDADGHQDILAAANDGNVLYLMPGTGKGSFLPAKEISLDGKVDAIAVGEIGGHDGLEDIAVAISGDKGSRLVVYEHPEGAFRSKPESFSLPSRAQSVALGYFDNDALGDIAVACGHELVMVHGHIQIYPWDMIADAGVSRPPAQLGQRSFPFNIAALVAGRFSNSTVDSIAMLSSDGAVHLLEPPAAKPSRQFMTTTQGVPSVRNVPSGGAFRVYKQPANDVRLSAEEMRQRGYATFDSTKTRHFSLADTLSEERPKASSSRKQSPKLDPSFFTAPSRIREWIESSWPATYRFSTAAQSASRNILTRARVSASSFDDLLIADPIGEQVYVLNRDATYSSTAKRLSLGKWESPGFGTLAVAGGPVALIPMRLNRDALSDLVILRNGETVPLMVKTDAGTTYIVNSDGDTNDVCTGSLPCTLRGAIRTANLNPGSDTIVFDLPGDGVHEINAATELPVIGESVTLDATTQPGYDGSPLIYINGSAQQLGSADGIKVRASDCVVRGLGIGLFPHHQDPNGSFIGGNGLTLETLANQTRHVNNIVEANYLGTDATGSLDQGNTSTGINVFDVDSSTIGGTVPEARNLISGNGNEEEVGVGIEVVNGMFNKFQGNYIGVDASGTTKLGNFQGIDLTGFLNDVGGDDPGAGNVISGNGEPDQAFPELGLCQGNGLGIAILTTENGDTNLTQFNFVKGNFIGTDPTGTLPVGNCGFGISTNPATQTQIGSITETGRNVISDNGFYAVNCSYTFSFVQFEGGFCIVSGNNIGTDVSGTSAMANDGRNTRPGLSPVFGVVTVEAQPGGTSSVGAPGGTTPGGPCTGFCNLISGNDNGNFLGDSVGSRGDGLNGIFNSFLGTDITGTHALPNYFGAGMTGNSYLGNVGFVLGPPEDTTPLGNLISGNSCGGAAVVGTSHFGDEPVAAFVSNNKIGTDVSGNNPIPNTTNPDCRNPGLKVAADSLSTVLVGGTTKPTQRNVISGNAFDGVHMQGDAILQNNYIGVGLNGTTAMGNTGHGIKILAIGSDRPNLIGGSQPETSNLITNNGGAGVLGDQEFPNRTVIFDVRMNSIFNNGGLGIDLFPVGVSPNDASDADLGPNGLQNYPSLDLPVFNANGTVTLRAWLNSAPSSSYRIDFYASNTADPTKYGEGQTFIGEKAVATDAFGHVEFTFTSTTSVSASQKITATATDSFGRTSEFSCVAGQCIADVGVTIDDDPDPVAAGSALTYTLHATNAGPATATNVVVTNTLPSTVNFGSAVATQGSCNRSGVTVTCNLGTINKDANATITIIVTPTTEGEITDTAVATRSEEDPVPDNDRDTERTQVGPAVITVTTNGDESDSDPGDNICDVDPNTTGSQCTLRAALELANSRAGRDAIGFNIPGGPNQTISPQSALPVMSQSVSIDATTQPGYAGLPVIVLNGAGAGGDAFKITAGNCYLAGFSITRFSGNGIVIQGGPGGNVIEGNIIGSDASGTLNIGLGGDGVVIDNSPNNSIGRGANAVARLRFSRGMERLGFPGGISNAIGACVNGIRVSGSSSVGNKALGNLVGAILKDGELQKIANSFGIVLQNALQTTVGGLTNQDGCTILGNLLGGVKVEGGSLNKLLGNFIGTNKSGLPGFGNLGPGILMQGTSQNEIGGSAPSAGNVVSGNQGPGILLKAFPNVTADLNKLANNILGGLPDRSGGLGNVGANIQVDGAADTTIESNSIVGSQTGCGVLMQDTQSLLPARAQSRIRKDAFGLGGLFKGNTIGLIESLGVAKVAGNLLGGICLENFFKAQIGDVAGNAANIIGGNNGPGISLFGPRTKGFKLLGNIIGTNRNGQSGLGNALGILIQGAQDGDIGGSNQEEANVISGNAGEALKAISTSLQDLSTALRITNNMMGVKPDGRSLLGNLKDAIKLDGATDVTITGNVLGGSQTGCGVLIQDPLQIVPAFAAAQPKGDRVRPQFFGITKIFGNSIGIGKFISGISPAVFANALGGICVDQTPGVLIGGAGPLGNLIAGNSNGPGILLKGNRTRGFGILGNLIGTTPNGQSGLGNLLGILVQGAQDGDIGGMGEGEGNVISGNTEEGVKAEPGIFGSPEFVTNMRIFANRFGIKPVTNGLLGNGKDGIMIDGGSQVTINNNTIAGSQNGCGVLFKDLLQRFSQIPDQIGLMKSNNIGVVEDTQNPSPRSGKGIKREFFGLGNVLGGICVDNVPRIQIGDVNAGNIIGANGGPGVRLSGIGTQLTQLLSNFIGTSPDGTPLGNLFGVFLQGAKNNTIGGSAAGSGNTIAFNQEGVVLRDDNGTPAELNRLLGNLIGLFRDLNNTLQQGANLLDGIRMANATQNEIGAPNDPGASNIISGNSGPGIVMSGPDTTFNKIFNNFIGTDASGLQPFGNASHGVVISGGASLNTVGGPASGAANTIAFNVGAGVALDGDAGQGNNLDPNSIFANNGGGIDLGDPGPTANDPLDADGGPNQLQNFPEITSAVIDSSGNLTVTFKVDSQPGNSDYGTSGLLVEMFKADSGLSGQTFLGDAHYTTSDYSNSPLGGGVPGLKQMSLGNAAALGVSVGDHIVGLATDAQGNSSEFTSTSVGTVVGAPTALTGVIDGRVTASDGTPVAGVTITMQGTQSRVAITASDGRYQFTQVETSGFYTVTPARVNFWFAPANRSFSIVANRTEAAFNAIAEAESANPIDTPYFFVRQQYLDFLNREPEEGGLGYWSYQLQDCGSDLRCLHNRRIGVAAAFFIESEFQRSGSFIYRVYKASFDRQPSYAEFLSDRRGFNGNDLDASQAAFAADWVRRAPFLAEYPESLTAAQFVNRLFDRARLFPYIDERQRLISEMTTAGKTRGQVLAEVVGVAEFKQREYNPTFVLMEYFGYLNRDPDPQGYDFWLDVLNSREPDNYRAMVCAFITSAEYQRRFSSIVTRTNADCGR